MAEHMRTSGTVRRVCASLMRGLTLAWRRYQIKSFMAVWALGQLMQSLSKNRDRSNGHSWVFTNCNYGERERVTGRYYWFPFQSKFYIRELFFNSEIISWHMKASDFSVLVQVYLYVYLQELCNLQSLLMPSSARSLNTGLVPQRTLACCVQKRERERERERRRERERERERGGGKRERER